MSRGDPQELQEILQTIQSIDPSETIRPTLLPIARELAPPTPNTSSELEPLGLLGEGGMGQVHLARQRSLDRQVAVKKVRPERQETSSIVGLLQEARRTGKLEHPNIIPVHAVNFDSQDSPAIIMKRVEGVSWRRLIQNPSHPAWNDYPDRIGRHLEILIQICNAVHFAHSHNIIHRDIKPDNVMLGNYGEVYLLDWGISLVLHEDPPNKELVGTLAYLAPEMVQGSTAISKQTDVYLLGASLHEVLTGSVKHPGTIREAISSALESSPFVYPGNIPEELGEICNKAMHVDPKERYESALAMREALSSFLRHRNSIDLSDTAQQKLSEAGIQKERVQLHKLFTEAKFGFEQALRIWAENKPAREGLQACLRAMFDDEIAQKNITAAEMLLSEMQPPDEKRRERLEEIRREIENQRREQARLTDLSHQLDVSVSHQQRMYFGLGIAGFMVLLSLIFVSLRRWQNAGTSYPTHIIAASGMVIFLCFLVFVGRNSLLKTAINRRTIYSFMAGAAAVPWMRTIGMIFELPISAIAACELLMMGMASALLGFHLQKGFFLSSTILLVSSLVCLFIPQYWLEIWMGSYLAFALSVSYVWKRSTS
jgi:serine/threonine protein kinase